MEDCVSNETTREKKNQISSFQTNRRIHLNRPVGVSSVDCWQPSLRISGSNSGYTMFRGSVKGTGYPLLSTVSLSLHLPASPCTITFQLHPTDVNSQYPYRLPTTQTPHYNPQTLYFPALIVCVSCIHISFVQN